nr:hypothetical protein [Candidatus Sigynarchaeota archaeon]
MRFPPKTGMLGFPGDGHRAAPRHALHQSDSPWCSIEALVSIWCTQYELS